MKVIKINQAGDTIVEVLMSLTVLATVIGSAYAIASRALIRTQQAQERVRATKLVEEQIERLKYLVEISPTQNPSQYSTLIGKKDVMASQTWCIGTDNLITSSSCTSTDNIFTKKFTQYNSSLNQFTVEVSWSAFRTGSTEKVTIMYRVPTL